MLVFLPSLFYCFFGFCCNIPNTKAYTFSWWGTEQPRSASRSCEGARIRGFEQASLLFSVWSSIRGPAAGFFLGC